MKTIKIFPLLIIFFLATSCKSQKNHFRHNLMPVPRSFKIEKNKFVIDENFSISVTDKANRRVNVATTKFLRRLSDRTGIFLKNGFAYNKNEINQPDLKIKFNRPGKLEINENESYHLKIEKNKISIDAETDIGVIYALETLLQLIDYDENGYFIQAAVIDDRPRFTWRGLMIDVARHFQPVEVIKRNLDAMAAVKMNVFHWHLSDDQGFRMESKTHPELHLLASDGRYYTQDQIKEVVQYASDRGIRVVPEIDVPGHATAILTAFPELASRNRKYMLERNAGIFNPTLDPTNEKTYRILVDLFGEMAALFPDKYFHIGGDENEGKDWDASIKIQLFMKQHALHSNHELQTYFNIKLQKILSGYGKKLMGWEEIMTPKMPKTALIHSWKGVNEGLPAGQSLINAVKNGYQTILSNGYYIDLMLPASSHYLVDPIPEHARLTAIQKARILGGEATMWSELVTPLSIDSRIWPRTAAIAERFWSPKEVRNVRDMYRRLEETSFRLEELGIMHIRNKDVILRKLANNQSVDALEDLSDVCEPLKIYTRNKGGTEYQSFSPFSLFADACTADAPDALRFSNLTNDYVAQANASAKKQMLKMLKKWSKNHEIFRQLKQNPMLKDIEPLSVCLSDFSSITMKMLNGKKLDISEINQAYQHIKKQVADVELALVKPFKKLIKNYARKNKLKIKLN